MAGSSDLEANRMAHGSVAADSQVAEKPGNQGTAPRVHASAYILYVNLLLGELRGMTNTAL